MTNEKIEWTPDMSVGVVKLDEDHKRLIQLLNEFVELTDKKKGFFIADHVFSELMDYTMFHFDREERIMEACDYPRLEKHKEEHKRLKERLIDCRDRYALSPTKALSDNIRKFLLSWLQAHIMEMDADYRSFVEGREDEYADVLKD